MVPHEDNYQLISSPIAFYIGLALWIGGYLVMTFTTDDKVLHLIEGAVQWVGAMLSLTAISAFTSIKHYTKKSQKL